MHSLPAELTSFIGRERELADIREGLKRARLMTLTGVGGGGKTHLAGRAARQLAPQFRDGVFLVGLAPLMDGSQVPRVVALALGVRGRSGQRVVDTVAGAISDRNLLLLLDNCEHVIAAAAHLVEALLSTCPALRILATSREPLRVPGESIMRVPPRACPRTVPSVQAHR